MEKTKYRIIEEEYGDGHKVFTAYEAIKFLGITIYWKKYIAKTDNYGYGGINYICCAETYDGCLEYLKESIKQKEQAKLKNTVKHTIYHEARV